MSNDAMYRDVILDYYRNPRNFGKLENSDVSVRDVNPLCGDSVEISLKIIDNMIQDIKFSGSGCAISQAAASMLTEHVKGKTLDEVKKMDNKDILDILGIEVSYSRLKCALLGLKVLQLAVYKYTGQRIENQG